MTYFITWCDEYTSRGFVTDKACFRGVLGHGSKMPYVGKQGCHGQVDGANPWKQRTLSFKADLWTVKASEKWKLVDAFPKG